MSRIGRSHHLRLRGEKLRLLDFAKGVARTTSACAERTSGRTASAGPRPHHLRLRGENSMQPFPFVTDFAPPPPTRRECGHNRLAGGADRTTSACAETTCRGSSRSRAASHHLRLRGENAEWLAHLDTFDAPPPPARRAREAGRLYVISVRTTFACAERTRPSRTRSAWTSHHLRLRGENVEPRLKAVPAAAPPPPARRERLPVIPRRDVVRTTSACAERIPSHL